MADASLLEVKVKLIGIGNSRFGLRLLGCIAKLFNIRLEVREEN
jgi:hypothetical protein